MQRLVQEAFLPVSRGNLYCQEKSQVNEQTILALLSASFDLDILDISSTQEFIKKTQREKKFCLKV
jgi:hypothetical protein